MASFDEIEESWESVCGGRSSLVVGMMSLETDGFSNKKCPFYSSAEWPLVVKASWRYTHNRADDDL